jgi:RND family efflux transporter MFP subunit
MNRKRYLIALALTLFLVPLSMFVVTTAQEGTHKEELIEGSVQYWTCGMHPSVRTDDPGKCPICNMDLVPVRSEEGVHEGHVSLTLSERARQLAGLRTSPVEYLPLERTIRAVGRLDYDERARTHIAAWISGRIDRLFVDFTGAQVRAGEPLLWIYSPELVTAQEEYLLSLETAKRVQDSPVAEAVAGARALAESSRKKLSLMGLTDKQIEKLEEEGASQSHAVIVAPASGTVIHKGVQEGQYVKEGQHLFEIADLSGLWMMADIFETDLALIEEGQEVEVTASSFPGETFHGRVSFVDPFLDPSTFSVQVRVEVPNPGGRLKPGLTVDARVRAPLVRDGEDFYSCPMHPEVISKESGECPDCGMFLERVTGGMVLAVPGSAVLDAGVRTLVYLDLGDGRYQPREVRVGPQAEARVEGGVEIFYPVLSGLAPGDRVVTRANFLIDSQSQLSGEAAGAYGGALETAPQPGQHVH